MLARATLKGLSALPLHHKGTSLTPTPWPTFYFSYRSSFMGNLLAKPSLSLRNLLERNRQTARASKQQNYIMRFADCLHHPVCCLIVRLEGSEWRLLKTMQTLAISLTPPSPYPLFGQELSSVLPLNISQRLLQFFDVLYNACYLPHTTNSPISAGYPTIQF